MSVRRAVTWLVVVLLLFGFPGLIGPTDHAYAAPTEQGCQTRTSGYDPGKTVEGFAARATDGCNVYEWTGSIGQGPGSGTVTFTTTNKVNPWDGDLPSMAGGAASYCRARAAHEANLMWMYGFKTGPGVQVSVAYSCD